MNRRHVNVFVESYRLVFLLVLLALPASVFATPFVHETVQSALAATGGDCSVAVDSKGEPHVSYSDATAGAVKYAHRSGGSWIIETVQTTGAQDWWTSIELNGSDAPRISYASNFNIMYASKSGAVWTIDTVVSAGAGDHYVSLALDPNGNPHISYRNFLVQLWHATKSGGVWTAQQVDGTGGNRSSIAVDSEGNPSIASGSDPFSGNLEYASKRSGTWTIELVLTGATSSSLALDAQGRPHISGFKTATRDLVYATKSSGTWTLGEVVETWATTPGSLTSISLSQAGLPRIAYEDTDTGHLKFATRSTSTWSVETVALLRGGLFWVSQALEKQDNPIICYYDSAANALKVSDSAMRLATPLGGETWAVGSEQQIRWVGSGAVSLLLSADGGETFTTLRSGVTSSPYTIRVPHLPTRFAVFMVTRSSPLSNATTGSFFTIDATIALAKFDAARDASGDGTRLAWETRPGPEADVRYRIERADGEAGVYAPLHSGLLDRGEYVDPAPTGSAHYRLVAVNGLGEEYVLGETSVAPALAADRDLVAYPNPAAGPIEILYRVPAQRDVDLGVFDVSGRRVRSLVSGPFAEGVRTASWDRRDDSGRDVATGTYYLRLTSANGYHAAERVTIVR